MITEARSVATCTVYRYFESMSLTSFIVALLFVLKFEYNQWRLVGGMLWGRWVRAPDGLRGFEGGLPNRRRRSSAIFVPGTPLEHLKNVEIIKCLIITFG